MRGQKKEVGSSFCPFARLESFLVTKIIGDRSDNHVTAALAAPRVRVRYQLEQTFPIQSCCEGGN